MSYSARKVTAAAWFLCAAQVWGASPSVTAVVNAASYASNGTVAPGSIVTVFGAEFGGTDTGIVFPAVSAGGLSVLFGDVQAPIVSLSGTQGQVSVMVPSELPVSGTVSLTVKTPGGTSAAVTLNLAAAVPGVFFYADPSKTTRRNAIAVVANTTWIAMPVSMAARMGLPQNCDELRATTLCGHPVRAGDYLQIYATGLGAATPNGDPGGAGLATGSAPPASGSPLYATVAAPIVTIGGQPATVLFSGLAPGFAGLYQVDIQLPPNTPVGNDVVIELSMPGGAVDRGTTIAVNK